MADMYYDITAPVKTLNNGGIIVFPTDTIWGIGCDASNIKAVNQIRTFKKRENQQGFILLVSDITMLTEYVGPVHPRLTTLLEHFSKPLSVIYPNVKGLPKEVLGTDNSVAIRIVKDEYCKQLIEAVGKPLVATSANEKGEPFPQRFDQITSSVLSFADHVVLHRQRETQVNVPSVLAKWTSNHEIEVLRS